MPLLLSGCAAAFGQTDNFRERLDRGCSSEEECNALVIAARGRDQQCEPNTIGQLRCTETKSSLYTAVEYRDRFLQKRREFEEAKRLAEIEKARREREDEIADSEQAAEEEAADKKRREAKKAAATERAEWLALDLPGCADRGEPTACRSVHNFILEYPENEHLEEAAAALKSGRAVMVALEEERQRRNEATAEESRRREQAAAEESRRRAQAAAAEAKKRRAAAPAAEDDSSSDTERSSSGNVCCCDGSISPTCRTVHRGCCSHHGGVCACN